MLLSGIDLVDNSKFKKMCDKNPQNLLEIFTADEISYCNSKAFPYQSFGARFAAKESVLKAIDADVWDYDLKDIQVVKKESGKPEIRINDIAISDKIKKLLSKDSFTISLSVSHEKGYSIAQVIIY